MPAAHPLETVAALKNEATLFFVLLQLAVIVAAGRIGGALAVRWRQSSAVGEIVAGLVLGPSLFGWLAPDTFQFVFRSVPSQPMQVLSGLGLVLLMFQIGLEFDFAHLRERTNRFAVLLVATASLLLPFALGLAVGFYAAPALSPHARQWHSALFVATAFSITALPILGRIMIEFKMTRTKLGVIAISAAAINDVIGWLMLALITSLTSASFDAGSFGLRIALVAAFLSACVFFVRPLLQRLVRRYPPRDGALPPNLLASLLAVILVAAMATHQIGIFAIFGAFAIGMILFDEHELAAAWRARVGEFVTVFFLPIFFTYTGLRTSIGGLNSPEQWVWCAAIVVFATLGKFGGAYLSARIAGLTHHESTILGFMMNTRALMELVVINVGYDLGVISQSMFTMLVIMAILSTVVTSPMLRHYLPLVSNESHSPNEDR